MMMMMMVVVVGLLKENIHCLVRAESKRDMKSEQC
jgi:hypothetical protein